MEGSKAEKGKEGPRCLAVVRIRGTVNVRREVRDTLRMLNLVKPNHATLVPATPQYLGMLQTAKDYIAWGEVSEEVIEKLLSKRGRCVGGSRLSAEVLQKLGFPTARELASALYGSKVKLSRLQPLKPVFRLRPPKRGFRGTLKRGFAEGGETGYRGDKINELLSRMI